MVLELADFAIDVISGSRTSVGTREVQRVELPSGLPRLVPSLLLRLLPLPLAHLDMVFEKASRLMVMAEEVTVVIIEYEGLTTFFDDSP